MTDASLTAGILGARDMLGGRGELRPGEAARALEQIARPLGRDVPGAADAVIEVATASRCTGAGTSPRAFGSPGR